MSQLPGWMTSRDNKWYHGVIAFLLMGVVLVGGNLIFEGKAFGSVPPGDAVHMRDSFRAGDYGRRKADHVIPDSIKKMMKAEYRSKVAAGWKPGSFTNITDGAYSPTPEGSPIPTADAWFKAIDTDANCIPYTTAIDFGPKFCMIGASGNAGANSVIKDTTKVILVCGAAGALGAIRGGGWWGFGIGGGGCLWGKMIDAW